MKRILDSVHGYIDIPDELVSNVIDTVAFQRLRRIEQTSGRSLFPCARHDRFMHSLGVFHLGCKIVERLLTKIEVVTNLEKHSRFTSILYTYEMACLLHDVGHTPFSHTFEAFYDSPQNKLVENLKQKLTAACKITDIEQSEFARDIAINLCNSKKGKLEQSAPHELISAIVSVDYFGDFIRDKHYWLESFPRLVIGSANGDLELLVRMIIGLKYSNSDFDLENIFIDLIHSKVLDADSLDYVCRDSWASGYRTNNVDIHRLLDSIYILYDVNNDGRYTLCYDVKAINEIQAALSIKDFQQNNVFTHHIVIYEQHLLVKAMEAVALSLLDKDENEIDEAKREDALKQLCDIRAFENGGFDFCNNHLSLPMDDDFISLMKKYRDNQYVEQWFSRNYDKTALWKTREGFISDFLIADLDKIDEHCWLYSNECRKFIAENFDIDFNDIWMVPAVPKFRLEKLADLILKIGDTAINFEHIYKPLSSSQRMKKFYYIFIPKKNRGGSKVNKNEIRKAVLAKFCEEYKPHCCSKGSDCQICNAAQQ